MRFIQPSRHPWQGVLKLSARVGIWLPNGINKRLNFQNSIEHRCVSDGQTSTGDVRYVRYSSAGCLRNSPVGRSAEPLNGISCNLASICICCRRILFLLWLTIVRWPVYPGRMQTGFCGRHDDYVPSSVTRGRPARHVFECFRKTRGQNIQNQPIPTHF